MLFKSGHGETGVGKSGEDLPEPWLKWMIRGEATAPVPA
jgi:hypothetical protein